MKRFKSYYKKRIEWDEHDASKILESGEAGTVEIAKVEYRCPSCESGKIRRRMIDLPVLKGELVLCKLRVYFCADCKTSVIEEASLKEFHETLHYLAAKDRKNFLEILNEAMASYEKKWQERIKERKVISIYFPTKEGSPAKAQISIMSSDPLYSQIRSLSSEAIRSLLGLQYYEELEKEALKEQRSISQYLKLTLAEKLHRLGDSHSKGRTTSDEGTSIVLFPELVRADYFRKAFPHARRLAFAAESKEEEILVFQTSDREFIGVLDYDYEKASLFLEIETGDPGVSLVDADLVMKDNKKITQQGLRVENNRILLLPDTPNIEKDVTQIVLKQKS